MGVISVDLGSSPLSFHAAWSGFWKKSLKERQAQLAELLEKLWGPNEKKDDIGPSPTSLHRPTNSVDRKHRSNRERRNCDDLRNSSLRKVDRNLLLSTESSAKRSEMSEQTDNSQREVSNSTHLTLPKLDDRFADLMIENCIGTISLPVGLGLNLTINDQPIIVPMCVEESSVVAALSSAAKTISLNGGFSCFSSEKNIVTAQVQLCLNGSNDTSKIIKTLEVNKEKIIDRANDFCPGMTNRGGGVIDIDFYEVVPPESYIHDCYSALDLDSFPCWVLANFKINVCDAMGANCANTVAEGVSSYLSELTGAPSGVRIVSNFLTDKLSTASFCIDTNTLSYKNNSGLCLARKIVGSNIWAACDINRAATHNKGVMNGIDAVALATGQDWRAVEAAAHVYATIKDPRTKYAPLTDYWIDSDSTNRPYGERNKTSLKVKNSDKLYLHGSLSLSIPIGVKGGALSMNSAYSSCLKILGPEISSKKLSEVIVAVGLAQNFAALRALCTVGIQSGHMALHAQNLAIQAGVPEPLIGSCTEYMKRSGKISVSAATEFLNTHNSSQDELK